MRTLAVTIAITMFVQVSFAQTSSCYADWSAASAIVKAHGLMTLDQLTKLAPGKLGGDIVRSTLCSDHGAHVYRLTIRDRSGVLKSVIVDAKNPF